MEKLLNLLSSKLQIRTSAPQQVAICSGDKEFCEPFRRFQYKEAPKEVKESFKKKLENHVFSKADQLSVGERLDYLFDYGKKRPLGTLMAEANDNMAEVLLQLPELDDGECYVLPLDTYFSFEVTEKDKTVTVLELKDESSWIEKEYNNQ